MTGRRSAYPSRRAVLRGGALAAAVATAGLASQADAADYPERPVKIIVPFAPGGPTDIMARILGTHLGEALNGTIVIENRPGGGGNIGIGIAAHAEPDGHTLLITSSAYVVNPGLYLKIPYDPFKDFAAIAELGTSPNVILVNPGLGINSIAALPPAHPHIESGALKALAVTGIHRWFDLPDVPTMIELGYKDFISDTFQGFLAPANTPTAIVARLSTKSIEILRTPKIAEQLRNDGFEVLANGPDGMRKRIADEVPKWRDVIAKAGIKPV
jgi:tripartite-type tricarboxylate transporter receptor subunit TctC